MKLFWQIIAISFFSISMISAQNSSSKFRAFVADKDFEKAGEVAQSALNENPNDFELAISVGDVFFELEEFNKAFDAYSRARTINNRDNRVAPKLANTLVALGRSQEAIDDLRRLLERDRRNVDLLLALANALLANGSPREAEMQVTNARSIDNQNPNVFAMLGKIYFERKIIPHSAARTARVRECRCSHGRSSVGGSGIPGNYSAHGNIVTDSSCYHRLIVGIPGILDLIQVQFRRFKVYRLPKTKRRITVGVQ